MIWHAKQLSSSILKSDRWALFLGQPHFKHRVVEEKQPEELVLHDILIPQKHEILNSLPISNESIVTT